ncbi:hypothetical protein [Streptomyces specialis]|uniref:hypothetical protein n=1 Tax=Streptomyces specialis TaxID=498367 RepID=UPI00073EBF47|nr:hypothetical protein [Streptomyces specialis]
MGTKRAATAAAVLGVVLSAAVVAAPAAHADNGNGLLQCSRGEICFKEWKHDSGNPGRRHFYYNSDNHHTTVWHHGGAFADDATHILNRDSACPVRVYKDVGYLGTYQTFVNQPASEDYWQNYAGFSPALYEENSSHLRC